jgi:hypothetical protein
MPKDRLEKILSDLSAEVESRREGDETRLAEWFAGVLGHERGKNERLLAFAEMLRQGHGPSEATGDKGTTEENA